MRHSLNILKLWMRGQAFAKTLTHMSCSIMCVSIIRQCKVNKLMRCSCISFFVLYISFFVLYIPPLAHPRHYHFAKHMLTSFGRELIYMQMSFGRKILQDWEANTTHGQFGRTEICTFWKLLRTFSNMLRSDMPFCHPFR